jgi:hypothetical protein
MEKNYTTPEMEITEFEAEDIITTSGENSGLDWETPKVPI